MQRFRQIILLFTFLVVTIQLVDSQASRQIPARREVVAFVQPNGRSLNIRLIGDERNHFYTTEDGFRIKRNKKGIFCYAKKDKKGNFVSSCRVAHNSEERNCCEKQYLKKVFRDFTMIEESEEPNNP